ncbi:MAG: prolipoprotein diacylglyceryl transferase [Planctomycetes bacterium]|nr:prolipoprotein diacylglyceryl transferase [Planctomycetota bacterium]
MRQVLFDIPLEWLKEGWHLPVYGYGAMLFLAFIFCNWMARRMCRREGIDEQYVADLEIWLFVSGIIGGRLVYVVWFWHTFQNRPLWNLIKLWDGGLVLYGALLGATIGYFLYYRLMLVQRNISTWKMIDVIAPCIALGIALGRVGCLFTGCCYGNVACTGAPALHFPLYTNAPPIQLAPPTGEMIRRGYQTPMGFLFKGESLEVEAVEPGSAAADVLKADDVIVEVNGKPVLKQEQVEPNVTGILQVTVIRGGAPVTLPAFEPRSIGVNPTQIYETISMCLLLFFLLSYYPFKRHDGELMVLLMCAYAVHRFINEMLRTDTEAVAFNMTLSQNISIGIFMAGVALGVAIWLRARAEAV